MPAFRHAGIRSAQVVLGGMPTTVLPRPTAAAVNPLPLNRFTQIHRSAVQWQLCRVKSRAARSPDSGSTRATEPHGVRTYPGGGGCHGVRQRGRRHHPATRRVRTAEQNRICDLRHMRITRCIIGAARPRASPCLRRGATIPDWGGLVVLPGNLRRQQADQAKLPVE